MLLQGVNLWLPEGTRVESVSTGFIGSCVSTRKPNEEREERE
jgi:hypothetical protein